MASRDEKLMGYGAAEEQGQLDPQPPVYIQKMRWTREESAEDQA
jgi:hypothetical protein